MPLLKVTTAVCKSFVLLLVISLLIKKVRAPRVLQCHAGAFELYAFGEPSASLDCKHVCDQRYEDLRKMPLDPFPGVNSLSSSQTKKLYADAQSIFWIDQCVAWLRYCFRQRAAILTVDKKAFVSRQSTSKDPALTCLCRSVFLLMQIRKQDKEPSVPCMLEEVCGRLTGRLNEAKYGLWSCSMSKFIKDVSCGKGVPMCPCCRTSKNQFEPAPCPDWPEVDELMNEPFLLGDDEWLPYDLHGGPQPEEGFPRGTVLEPQRLACPVEGEAPSRLKAALLPFRTFETSACAPPGSCAAGSSGESQMYSHFETIGEGRERTQQWQECLRPPQTQGRKRKAVATAEVSCSISALASIQQPQNDMTTHGSQFTEAGPFPFLTWDVDEPFFGPQFVFAQTDIGEGHSIVSAVPDIDPENFQTGQVFAESSDFAAEHAATPLDPENLQYSQSFPAAGSAATTESISPACQSNSGNPAKDRQNSQDVFKGIP